MALFFLFWASNAISSPEASLSGLHHEREWECEIGNSDDIYAPPFAMRVMILIFELFFLVVPWNMHNLILCSVVM